MLSLQELQQKSVQNQVALPHIAREYYQNLFLSYFYALPQAENYLFKGGTCLKIVYQSPRYSEDLDFTGQKTNFNIFEDLLQKTLLQIEKTGIKTDIEECKKTTGGYFSIINSRIYHIKTTISLQISLRESGREGAEIILVHNGFLPAYNAAVLPLQELVKEKVSALLERAKPRDFYDLYFIMRHPVLRKFFPNSKRKAVVDKLKKISSRGLEQDLKPFLPVTHQNIIKNLPEVLLRELV